MKRVKARQAEKKTACKVHIKVPACITLHGADTTRNTCSITFVSPYMALLHCLKCTHAKLPVRDEEDCVQSAHQGNIVHHLAGTDTLSIMPHAALPLHHLRRRSNIVRNAHTCRVTCASPYMPLIHTQPCTHAALSLCHLAWH